MSTGNSTRRTTKSDLAEQLLIAEVTKTEAEATVIEDKVRELKGPNYSSRSLRLLGKLGPQVSAVTLSVFSRWNRMDALEGKHQPRTVFLNSPGGRFADSFAIYDVFRIAQEAGTDITVQTTGLAGTQAAVTMQAAKRRIMTPRSWLILNEIQPDPRVMNTAEGEEAVKYMQTLETRGWKLLLGRKGCSLTLDELKAATQYGRQFWISAEQALKYGLIDEIGTVSPDPNDYAVNPALLPAEGDTWKRRLEKAKLRKFLAEGEIGTMTVRLQKCSAEEAGKHYFFGEVDTESCTEAQAALTDFSQRGMKDVEMVINSPGGSVFDGCGLMDVIEQTMTGRQFTTTIFGEAASMAGVISQTGTRRLMASNASYLIHRVSSFFGMSSSHMADNARNMKRLEDVIFPFIAGRTGGLLPLETLQEKCKEHDWWLTADEAKALGLVDEVI